MSAPLTEKDVRFTVKALVDGAGGSIQGDPEFLENLCENWTAFLSVFLDGTLDGKDREYKRGAELTAKGLSLVEKLGDLSSEKREAIVRAAATVQAQCADGSMDADQALDSEAPPASSPAPGKPTSEPEHFGRCPCSNCNVIIEFPVAGVGQTVVCPKCGFDVLLFDGHEGSAASENS